MLICIILLDSSSENYMFLNPNVTYNTNFVNKECFVLFLSIELIVLFSSLNSIWSEKFLILTKCDLSHLTNAY